MGTGRNPIVSWLMNSDYSWVKWVLAAVVVMAVIGVCPGPTQRVSASAMRANCQSNLRQIGLAINGYAEDFGQDFPPSLAELYPDYVNNARLYKCPADSSASCADFAAHRATEKSSSYVYLPGRFAAAPGDFVLAYDRSKDHHVGAGINAVFVDGHVEWVPAAKMGGFMQRIADQEAQLPALRRKWEEDKAASTPAPGDASPAKPDDRAEQSP